MLYWALVGVFGVGTFQGLCMGSFENIAWALMVIPVLVLCFFMAVALLASSIRIRNVVSCDSCGRRSCNRSCRKPKPKCHRSSHTCLDGATINPDVAPVKPIMQMNYYLGTRGETGRPDSYSDEDDFSWPNKYWYMAK
jgi:hypothetical protein